MDGFQGILTQITPQRLRATPETRADALTGCVSSRRFEISYICQGMDDFPICKQGFGSSPVLFGGLNADWLRLTGRRALIGYDDVTFGANARAVGAETTRVYALRAL